MVEEELVGFWGTVLSGSGHVLGSGGSEVPVCGCLGDLSSMP